MRSITPCPSALQSSSTQLVDILAQLLSSRFGRARAMARFVYLAGLAFAVGDTSVAVPEVNNGTSTFAVLLQPTGVFPMPSAMQSALPRPSLRGSVFGSNLTAVDGVAVSCAIIGAPCGGNVRCPGNMPYYGFCGSSCYCHDGTCNCR